MTPAGGSARLRPLATANTEPTGRTLYWLVRVLHVFVGRLTDRAWYGQDKVPPTGGALIVANHISYFDPIAIGQFLAFSGRWPHFLAKASLFRVPVMGRIIAAAEQIPVERGSRTAAGALEAAARAVADGRVVVIYPEGTVTLDPDLWPMAGRTGAARVALQTRAPVVPVGQWGAQAVMPGKHPGWPRFRPRATLAVKAGDPVDLDDLRDGPLSGAVLQEATVRMTAAITTLVAELRGEPAPAQPLDPRAAHEADQAP